MSAVGGGGDLSKMGTLLDPSRIFSLISSRFLFSDTCFPNFLDLVISFWTVSWLVTPHSAAIATWRLEGVGRREGGRDNTLISETDLRELARVVSRDRILFSGSSGTGPWDMFVMLR